MGEDDHIKSTVSVYNSIATQYALQAEAHAPEKERLKFLELMPQGGCVLDVGCGSGRDAAYFESRGLEVAGVDLSASLLTIARKVASCAEFYEMDMRRLTFPDNSYDGIWCCAALLHLKHEEILPVVKSFYRILKAGGVCFARVKSGTGEQYDIAPSTPGKARYFSYFTEEEFMKFFTDAGFSIVSVETFNESKRYKDGYDIDWIDLFAQKP